MTENNDRSGPGTGPGPRSVVITGGSGSGTGIVRKPSKPAPTQYNQKKDVLRVNERIGVPQVRVIDDTGKMIGVYLTKDAVRMARERGLDLLEVSPTADPPVCKMVDYGKFKYEKKKKEHEAKKKQTVINVKEVQLRPQTEEHDLDYKFKHVKRFLEDGDKAKVSVMFRGREIAYVDQGRKLLDRLIDMVKDVGTVEAPPKLEGKRLTVILAPSSGKV